SAIPLRAPWPAERYHDSTYMLRRLDKAKGPGWLSTGRSPISETESEFAPRRSIPADITAGGVFRVEVSSRKTYFIGVKIVASDWLRHRPNTIAIPLSSLYWTRGGHHDQTNS